MSRVTQKARRRQNRRMKRCEEHRQKEESLNRKNMYGNTDLTAYYAIFNTMHPNKPRYGI